MTLDDDLILLQIDLLRHDAHLRHEMMWRLGKAQRAALAALIDGKHDVAVLRAGYAQAGEWLEEALAGLMPVAAAAFAHVYRKHLGEDFAIPDKFAMPEVYGASVSAWMAQQAGKQAFILRRLARLGRVEGQDAKQIADAVRKAWQSGNAQSETLVRTASAQAASDANLAVMLKSRRVQYLIHKSHLDSRTTGICRARHNKRWTKALEPVGHNLEFRQPPLHWNCRSIIKPLPDDKLRDEDDYDFDEWLTKMPVNIQKKALGEGKAAIWQAAKAKGQALTIHDLLDQKGRELTLHELARRYPETADAAGYARYNVDNQRVKWDKSLHTEAGIAADVLLNQASDKEKEITTSLVGVERDLGIALVGLDYRFKSKESLIRKILTKMAAKDISAAAAAESIDDVLRYTFLLSADKFVVEFHQTIARMQMFGHKAVSISNTWRQGAPYKGVNAVFEQNGQRYELQFHTQQSFDLKNGELHELYEQFRTIGIAASEKERLLREMVRLSDNIPQPKDINSIRSE